ncbi:MAG: sigma-54-dependent Fis family transcriptional regulator [Myxococcota bacterium]|nr:sigma-54-dependent Fis family transcriptional regulator [Myxococcota bacterium]
MSKPPLPRSLHRVSIFDPALAEELEEDFMRLMLTAEALIWAQSHLPALLHASTPQSLLSTLVDIAKETTGVPRAWGLTWKGDPAKNRISIQAFAGDRDEAVPPPSSISRTVVGQVAAEGRPSWSNDATADARFGAAESVRAYTLRSVGCLPVGTSGVLYLVDPDAPGRFTRTHRLQLSALCALAGRTLDARVPSPQPSPKVPRVPGLVGETPVMQALSQTVHAFAPMPWPALILGETGTGKEAIARALHNLSPRRDAPFLAVNCGAIVASLAESELFGHEKGSFTGAERTRHGLVSRVGKGTLFLDEIGELSGPLQVKLLRLLQEGTYQRVGGEQTLHFTGRVVAATHQALQDGDFREDLYYRLAACVVPVPPLRDRRADIPALAEHLLNRIQDELPGAAQMHLDPAAINVLTARDWPGNVRQLENTLRSAAARCLAIGGGALSSQHLHVPGAPSSAQHTGSALKESVAAFERQQVIIALAATKGSRGEASKRLGISRQWLHRLMTREGLL